MEKITSETIHSYLERKASDGLSVVTVRMLGGIIKSVLRVQGFRPKVILPKNREEDSKVLTHDEQLRLEVFLNKNTDINKLDVLLCLHTGILYNKFFVVLDVLNKLGVLYKTVGECFESIGSVGNIMNYNQSLMKTDINSLCRLHYGSCAETSAVRYSVVQNADTNLNDKIFDNDFVVFADVWESIGIDDIKAFSNALYISRIKIIKKPIKVVSDILEPLGDEYIYIISKSPKWSNILSDYSMLREKNTQV
ncbi:hypothetical protein FACS1894202_14030 [Clostridia bacterium]|nr:hypothetical protein FACS1894202_14030 [Clostridia bacterium]